MSKTISPAPSASRPALKSHFMVKIFKPLPVKLIVGFISSDRALFEKAQKSLIKKFGKADFVSPLFDFDKTDYYEKEMGQDLKRSFVSFRDLIAPERLIKIKLFTNALEKKFSNDALARAINIDPGYVTLSKLVLATTKSFVHRIYMGRGIFEEVTLYYKGQGFLPGNWTYPEFRCETHIAVFNEIRKKYYQQIEKQYGLSQLYRCI